MTLSAGNPHVKKGGCAHWQHQNGVQPPSCWVPDHRTQPSFVVACRTSAASSVNSRVPRAAHTAVLQRSQVLVARSGAAKQQT
jgi:hypothetical protein